MNTLHDHHKASDVMADLKARVHEINDMKNRGESIDEKRNELLAEVAKVKAYLDLEKTGNSVLSYTSELDAPAEQLDLLVYFAQAKEFLTNNGISNIDDRLDEKSDLMTSVVEDIEEAPTPVPVQSDGVTGKEKFIVDQIAQVPQRVTGHQESLHLEIADLHRLPVFEQMIPVRDGHGVFQPEGADLLTVPGIGEIVFLALAQINPGVLKSILLTNIQSARMIWVGMGQEQRLHPGRVHADLLAALQKSGMTLIARVDGYEGFILAEEKDVHIIFPDTADHVCQFPGGCGVQCALSAVHARDNVNSKIVDQAQNNYSFVSLAPFLQEAELLFKAVRSGCVTFFIAKNPLLFEQIPLGASSRIPRASCGESSQSRSVADTVSPI
jgi:hypothetical protein